jgi:16S rRNA (adenine1518-N6/adenine1519-N6)-dimethyltransferase
MKLSEMKYVLDTQAIQLTKSLGQNFLHDGNQLRRIVQAAQLRNADNVLEIGPGLGPLTELLVEAVERVLAIEKDLRLVRVLQERFAARLTRQPSQSSANLELLHADALEYLKSQAFNWSGWKLVANLPYAVASPLLVELALARPGPDRMVATLQHEVGRRLMAEPGQADYGILTLLIQLNYEPVESFKIPASCFFPEPDVDSACVVLARRAQEWLPPDQQDLFASVVKRSFSQRRKMMAKLLKNDYPAATVANAFAATCLPPQIRAEAVSLGQFVSLTKFLYERGNL